MKLESISFQKPDPLEKFSEEEKKIINERLSILSVLCFHVSKDFVMKVEVNEEGEGWHWNFQDNVVKADAKDLLEKPMDYLRFVIQHEAGHRRISRVLGVIPDDVWGQTGFSFMTNAIEDPRDNNFVADNVPKFKDEMKVAYEMDETFEEEMKVKAKDKLGQTPRFMQAGFEYIKIWFAERVGEKREIDEMLPDDVKNVVRKTLVGARKSWNTYPTKNEADNGVIFGGKKLSGEETVVEYARASYMTNLQDVWPEFKKLIDKDVEDEKKKQQEKGKGEGKEMTEDEAKKIAEEIIKGLEKELNDKLEGKEEKGKMDEGKDEAKDGGKPEDGAKTGDGKSGDKKDDKESEDAKAKKFAQFEEDAKKRAEDLKRQEKDIAKIKHAFDEKLKESESDYESILTEVAPIIITLENELREIFVRRRASRWDKGHRSGKRIDVQQFIQEEAKDVSISDTKMFMKHELPHEEDYAIELLVDLSGSMAKNGKIDEAIKALIVMSEVLKNIGISFSVNGFNTEMYSVKNFGEEYDDISRQKIMDASREVRLDKKTDDAWALDKVSTDLLKQTEKIKILFCVSDGQPMPSGEHPGYDLSKVIKGIDDNGKIRLIGLGFGQGTEHVNTYYKEAIANVDVKEFAKRLADKVREVIEGK